MVLNYPRRDPSGTQHTVTLSEAKGAMLEMVPLHFVQGDILLKKFDTF